MPRNREEEQICILQYHIQNKYSSQAWQCMPVMRQEDHKFKASLNYVVRPFQEKNKQRLFLKFSGTQKQLHQYYGNSSGSLLTLGTLPAILLSQ
jgi:hypothetical protein